MKKIITLILFIIGFVPTTVYGATVAPHAAGTNIVYRGTVYTIHQEMGLGALAYSSANSFLSYKFNSWAGVKLANSGDIELINDQLTASGGVYSYKAPPRPGSLINDNGVVYQILNGKKVGFTSESVFREFGYSFSNVYTADVSNLDSEQPLDSANQRHPVGSLINDNGTLYILLKSSKLGVPSLSVLNSWGYWISDQVPANNFDRALPSPVTLGARQTGQQTVYDSEYAQGDEY